MRRNQTQKISDSLSEFRQQPNIDRKLAETELLSNWAKLLGPSIEKGTRNIFITNRTLFVFIDSAVMRHELFMIRSQIMHALNKSVGGQIIDNIIFK